MPVEGGEKHCYFTQPVLVKEIEPATFQVPCPLVYPLGATASGPIIRENCCLKLFRENVKFGFLSVGRENC